MTNRKRPLRTGPYSCDDPETRVPRMYVDRPGPGPTIQYGLFASARILENISRHELNGIEHEPVCNTEVYEWPEFCASYGLYAPSDADRLKIGRPDPKCYPFPFPEYWKDPPEDEAQRDGTEGYENPRFNGDGTVTYYEWEHDENGDPVRIVEKPPVDFDPPYALKRVDPTKGLTWADPFAVYAGESCFLGNHENEVAVRNLRERFDLGEQESVERVIYNGFLPDPTRLDWSNNQVKDETHPDADPYPDPALPHLRPALRWDPVVLNGGQRTPLWQAIGLLEHWLQADSGARGLIHAPAYMASTIGGGQLMTTSGPRAMTRLGHTYVFGTGYSGRKPLFSDGRPAQDDANPPAGDPENYAEAWLYATRPITIRRSALIEPADWTNGAVNLRNNTGSMLVERVYVVDWPCSHAAIRTDFPLYRLDEFTTTEPAPVQARPIEPGQTTFRRSTEEESR